MIFKRQFVIDRRFVVNSNLTLLFSQRMEQDTSILVLRSIHKEDLELTSVNCVAKSLMTGVT